QRLETLAEHVDNRRRVLGAQVAEEKPAWAVQALGEVPEDPLERQEWERRAGWAAAAREAVGYTDEQEPLGPPPPAGMPEKHALWRTAHLELDLPDRSPEEAQLSDGALRNRVAAFERERLWAPRYVAAELAATAEAGNKRRASAALLAERAEREDLPEGEREQMRQAAEEAAREAEELAVKRAQLEEADRARAEWAEHTAVTRELAERAKVELASRGVALDDPGDNVSADEWLELEAQARAEDDAFREVDERSLVEEEALPVVELDGPAAEVAVDIRERAVPDESEFSDEPPQRRVPDLDATAAAVARAREALL